MCAGVVYNVYMTKTNTTKTYQLETGDRLFTTVGDDGSIRFEILDRNDIPCTSFTLDAGQAQVLANQLND
jgi:hypothetical protein